MATLEKTPKRYRLKVATFSVIRDTENPASDFVGLPMTAPDRIAQVAHQVVRRHDDDRERLWVLALDMKFRIRFLHLVSVGSQSMSVAGPLEIFGSVLRLGCPAFALFHNHPSEACDPSREDASLTERIARGSKLLNLQFVDHVIIPNGGFGHYSFRVQRHDLFNA
jgi:DNA repair protein RadC